MVARQLVIVITCVALLTGCGGTPKKPKRTNPLYAAQANTQLGVEYLRAGDLERARDRLESAVSQAPDYAPAHDAIAILYERTGDNDNAEKHFRRSLRLDPRNAASYNNYGQFLCKTGRTDEAEETFNKAAGDPYYRTPWVPQTNAGICLLGVQENARAESYFREALTRNPAYAPALLNMARLSFADGNYLSARGYIERYQQAAAHTAESLWLAIQTEYALNDHAAWGNYALKLKVDFPDSQQYRMLQEWENERRP